MSVILILKITLRIFSRAYLYNWTTTLLINLFSNVNPSPLLIQSRYSQSEQPMCIDIGFNGITQNYIQLLSFS